MTVKLRKEKGFKGIWELLGHSLKQWLSTRWEGMDNPGSSVQAMYLRLSIKG